MKAKYRRALLPVQEVDPLRIELLELGCVNPPLAQTAIKVNLSGRRTGICKLISPLINTTLRLKTPAALAIPSTWLTLKLNRWLLAWMTSTVIFPARLGASSSSSFSAFRPVSQPAKTHEIVLTL